MSVNYTELQNVLAHAGTQLCASEVHGIIVGGITNYLQCGQKTDPLQLIAPTADKHLNTLVDAYYQHNSTLLQNGDTEFDLLLPDDNAPLSSRVDSFIAWVNGYLLGLLHNKKFDVNTLPSDSAEFINDMITFTSAKRTEDDCDEEDWALTELQEYVKVGVQLIIANIGNTT